MVIAAEGAYENGINGLRTNERLMQHQLLQTADLEQQYSDTDNDQQSYSHISTPMSGFSTLDDEDSGLSFSYNKVPCNRIQ